MNLINIEPTAEHIDLLYQLLLERPAGANISHSEMPSYDEHVMFVGSKPYYKWLAIDVGGTIIGSIYITDRNEIGIAILATYSRCGYAYRAIKLLMEKYDPLPAEKSIRGDKFIANINPKNIGSIALFAKLGFSHISNTYEVKL